MEASLKEEETATIALDGDQPSGVAGDFRNPGKDGVGRVGEDAERRGTIRHPAQPGAEHHRQVVRPVPGRGGKLRGKTTDGRIVPHPAACRITGGD